MDGPESSIDGAAAVATRSGHLNRWLRCHHSTGPSQLAPLLLLERQSNGFGEAVAVVTLVRPGVLGLVGQLLGRIARLGS